MMSTKKSQRRQLLGADDSEVYERSLADIQRIVRDGVVNPCSCLSPDWSGLDIPLGLGVSN
jgi:hypothetical protein